MVTPSRMGQMAMQNQMDRLVPPPPGTGIPQAMSTPPGTGIPQAIPQGGPPMPQGGPPPPPSGLAGIPPAAPPAPATPDPMQIMGGVAMAVLARTSKETNKVIKELTDSAKRTGVTMPDMSPENGGLPAVLPENGGRLMRLAAGGGRVVYRRESGVVDPEQTTAERNAIIQQISDTAQNFGVSTKYWDMTKPLSMSNNPAYFSTSGDDPALAGSSMGQLVSFQYPGSGVPQNQIGGTTYGVPQGYGGFRAEHERLLGQLKEDPVGIRDFQPLGSVSDLSDTNISGSPQLPSSPPTDPTSLPTPADIQIYNEDRYGGLEDPNLPPLDAAQLRNLYRQQVGYFDTPPGPTDNTRRLLDQAYGRGTPVYDEVLEGLQPRPIANTEQAARRAYDNLPDDVKIVTEDTVTAAGGGGLLPLVRRLSMGQVRPNASEQEIADHERNMAEAQEAWERQNSGGGGKDGGGPQVYDNEWYDFTSGTRGTGGVPPEVTPPVAPQVTGDPNYQPITSNTQLPTGLDEYGNQLRAREAGVYYSPTEKTQTADVFSPPPPPTPTSTPGTPPVSPPPVYPDDIIDETIRPYPFTRDPFKQPPVMGQPAFRDVTLADMQANPGGFGNMMQQLIPGWNATNAQNQLQNQYQPYQPQAQQAAGGFGGANLYGQTTGNAFGNQFGANPYGQTGGPMAQQATGFGAANPYGQTTGNVFAAQGGGLYELAAGGEFSGRVPGDGGGMQDNVRMPIKEGANQVATLAVSPTEYVVDSHTMAALGNGNPDRGADHMDNVIKGIRRQAYGNDKQPNQIDGLRSLRSMMG